MSALEIDILNMVHDESLSDDYLLGLIRKMEMHEIVNANQKLIILLFNEYEKYRYYDIQLTRKLNHSIKDKNLNKEIKFYIENAKYGKFGKINK